MKCKISLLYAAILVVSHMVVSGCKSGVTNADGSLLTAITVTVTDPVLAPRATRQFTAIGTYMDNTTQDITNQVLWLSSDQNRVTINHAGLATGIAAGAADITASLAYVNNSVTVTITDNLQVIAVQPGSWSIDAIGYYDYREDYFSANGIVKVQFNNDINPDTLNEATFKVLNGSLPLAGDINYDAATRSAEFTFRSAIANEGYYQIVVNTDVLDLHGGKLAEPYILEFYAFNTSDSEPPAVVSLDPGLGSIDVPLDRAITIAFNEPIDIIGLTNSNIRVMDQNGNSIAGMKLKSINVVDPDLSTYSYGIIFTPLAPLEKATTYSVVVQGVKDYAGNVMTSQFTDTFSTLPITAPDQFAVTQMQGGQAVLSWLPVDGATSYNVYYSATTGVNKQNGIKIANVSNPYTHTGLSDSTYYYIVTAVNDLGEGPPSSEVSTVIDTTPPTVIAVSPADGATDVLLNQRLCVSISEAINGWNAANMTVIDDKGLPAAGFFSGNRCSSNTFPFQPWPNLKHDTQYTVTVNVTDTHGNAMASPYSWSFTTQSMAAPVITARPNSVPGMIYVSATNSRLVNATAYRIYYSQTPGVTLENGIMQSSPYASTNVSDLTSGATYYFIMTGMYGDEEGPISNEVSAVAP